MHLLNNSRLAWTIALSSLALWLGGAPISRGDARLAGVQQVAQSEDASAAATMVDVQVGDASVVGSGDAQPSPQCPVLPPAIAQVVPPSTDPGPPPPARDGTFHICGADPQAERTIEQLIAGRGFNATLSARGDGCADLT